MRRSHVLSLCCAALALQLSGQPSPEERLVRMAANGDLAAVRSLLAAGADPNAVDNSDVRGWTALMAAAKAGSIEVMEALLNAHANVNVKNAYGATALDIAVLNRGVSSPVVAALIAAGGIGREESAPPSPVWKPRSRPPTARTSSESIANVEAAIQEPRIVLRVPGLKCEATVTKITHDYQIIKFGSRDTGTVPVEGEAVTINLRQDGIILATGTWLARMPLTFDERDWPRKPLPADVRAEDLFVQLFHSTAFTPDDLATLVFSKLVEVRIGAAANLNDQALLARIASNDDHPLVREAAVKRIKNQTVLASLAANDASPLVREAAAWILEDQDTLTKLAAADPDENVRARAGAQLRYLQRSK